mmetsp:Transcript_124170/g.322524  ORF Transcript_124170/g.322524 Transcript_124170/m.322524 type:complete len:262 (+) Transcript_124170:445-1230(+)
MDGLFTVLDILTLPPPHVVGLFQQVVAHPARDGKNWGVLLNEVFLPANLDQHALHLVGNLVITSLLVGCGVAIHLVHADADLLHAQQVDKPGMLPSLALDLTGLVVALGDGCGKVAICRDHDERDIRLRCPGDHILDEVAVSWGIYDGIVPLLRVELLGGARDRDTALALLLLAVHVESECEGALAEPLGLRLELLELALRQPSELEDEPPGRGALAAVDMAADHDRQMLLLRVGRHRWQPSAGGCARPRNKMWNPEAWKV